MEDPASLGWSIFLISILFIVYSACLFIKESSLEATAKHLWYRGNAIESMLQKLSRSKWNVIGSVSLLCLMWIGGLLVHVHIILFKPLVSSGGDQSLFLWLSTMAISIILALLLQVLHQAWIPRFIRGAIDRRIQRSGKSGYRRQVEEKLEHVQQASYDFGEKTAREVMTPRLDMICLQWNRSFSDNIDTAIRHMKTRYPIVKDDKDDIIGFVHMKDLLARYDDYGNNQKWRQSIRPIITVPENMSISTLLSLMQTKKTQIALLIDEYGGTSGMATLEDILEEIVGDIQDEFDHENHNFLMIQPNYYQISAKLLVEEVNSYFQIDIEVDNMDSIGGYMYANIQFPPQIGQSVHYNTDEVTYVFTIEQMDQLRITSIGVRKTIIMKSKEYE